MSDHIICPHCKRSFPATQAFSHQLEEELQKRIKTVELEAERKAKEQIDIQLKNSHLQNEEMKKQNKELKDELLDMMKQLREMKQKDEQRDLEYQKKLQEDEEKIKKLTEQKVEEKYKLKIFEDDKEKNELRKKIYELQQKVDQKSQQTQGEVLEEYLESTLRTTFIYDEIQPVPKGVKGADVLQIVKNRQGSIAGKIIWESKRTKTWSNDWIPKLKADKRSVNADEAILITNNLPTNIKGFGYYEGVYVTNYDSIIGVTTLLRNLLLLVAGAKSTIQNMNEPKDQLFQYVLSPQFRNRVEAISEAFSSRREIIDVEKRWFTKKWAREEKLLENLLNNNESLMGEIEQIIGKELEPPKEIKNSSSKKKDEDIEEGSLF